MPLLDSLEERKRQRLMDMLAEMTSKPQPVTDPALRQQFPKTYGFLGGVMGTAPDEFEGSVLDPQSAQVRAGAEMSFYPGALAQMVGGLPMKSEQIGKGLLRGAENLAAPSPFNLGTRGQGGAIVYHGSPHKFDKFDSSKIGTGEGAQAYGHGLYLAENPGVAKGYQIQNAYKAFDVGEEATKRGIPLNAGGRGEFIRQANANKDPVKAAKALQNANIGSRSIPAEDLQKMFADYQERGGGAFYKVDLPDEHIAKMLDWDKPLSEQAPEVQAAMGNALTERGIQKSVADYIVKNKSGSEALSALSRGHYDARLNVPDGAMAAEASKRMQQAGIPGIRYLDGGSRTGGAGTSNYVVFPGNEGLLNIMERNGESLAKPFVYPQGKALDGAKSQPMRIFDTQGLPNSGRDLIQSKAETLADQLKQNGFQVDLQHSGSAAGPSSYLRVYDPKTGRYFDNVRLSGHSKGVFNTQGVRNVASDEELEGVVKFALDMRGLGPSSSFASQQGIEEIAQGLIADGIKPRTAYSKARAQLEQRKSLIQSLGY